MRSMWIIASMVLGVFPCAHGAYVLTPVSEAGESSASIMPGQTVVIEIRVTSDAFDEHTASVMQVEFSASGLRYLGYTWGAPYMNGTLDDFSTPFASQLPADLNADLLSRVGDPEGVTDIELSNVLGPGQRFGHGLLVSLLLEVPIDYSGPGLIEVAVRPDQFFDGFSEVPATSGGIFTMFIPSPSTALVAGLGLVASVRRRRCKD